MGFSQYIGSILKRRRRELGLSLDEIAALSGISRSNVANIERGSCDTSGERLFTLLVCLSIDPRCIYKHKQDLLDEDERFCSERDFLLQKRTQSSLNSQNITNLSACKV